MKPTPRYSNQLQNDNTDQDPRLEDTGRGLTCTYRGKVLYSRHNPAGQSLALLKKALIQEKTLYFVPSPLLGYGLNELLEILPGNSAILSVETDQLLMRLSVEHLPQEILRNVRFTLVRTDSVAGVLETVKKMDLWKFRRCQWLPLGVSHLPDLPLYQEFFIMLQLRIKNFWNNRMTSIHLGRLWLRNFLRNIPRYAESVPLQQLKQEKPVLLCGAGESLEFVSENIHKERDHFFVLAVDTALPTLCRSGIIPDAVLVLEAQYWNILDFYQTINREIPVIADLTAYPPSLDCLTGPLSFFMTRFSDLKILDRFESMGVAPVQFPPLGSVGVTGLAIARFLSSGKPVWIAGLDFAYRRGKIHARGTYSHDLQLINQDRLHPEYLYRFAMERKMQPVAGQKSLFTDTQMEYSAQLFLENRGDTQVYRLSPEYYPLGITEQDREEDSFNPNHMKPSTPQQSAQDNGDKIRHALRNFVAQESEFLSALINEWARYENHGKSDTLLNILKDCDYITYHFADPLPHPRDEVPFLFKAVAEARKINALLSHLHRF